MRVAGYGEDSDGAPRPGPLLNRRCTSTRQRRTARMARIEVVTPQMGESIAEGTIVKWYKKVGDPVKKDETLLEISTDKVDSEIPSPAAGIIADIVVPEQKTVPVRTVIAYIETNGEGAKAEAVQPQAKKAGPVQESPAAAATPAAPLTERPAA